MVTEATATRLVLRVAGAGLTATMAAIHLRLWAEGYRDLATIGPLFLLNAVIGAVLAVALLLTPVRGLPAVAAVTALFTAGTLGALVLSLTTGLFGFVETLDAELVRPTLYVEAAGTVVSAVLAVTAAGLLRHRRRERPRHPHTGVHAQGGG